MNIRLLLLTTLLHWNTVTVRGNYNLSITLLSYTNPNNWCIECRDEGIGCCDDFEERSCSGGERCETYFEYCLLPLNTVASSGPVSCTVLARSNPGVEDTAINFAQSTVLGLSNPLVLRQTSSPWNGIQLQVTAIDDDSSNDDLIDFFQLNINSGVTSGSPLLNGFYGLAQLSLSYQVDLDNCVGIDCSGQGRCIDGQNSYTCICNSGFTGANCDTNIDDCVGVMCSGNGQCVDSVNSFTCSCNLGFTGATCQTNIDDCTGIDCSGHGRCVDGVNSYSCSCDPGFTGATCQTNIDDCIGIDCSGHGQCVDGVDSYTCTCDTGFTGVNCAIDIDDCTDDSCSGNGVCTDGVSSFTCECDSGYTGEFCETDLCSNINCGNGSCNIDDNNTPVCACDQGYAGDSCQIIENSCSGGNCDDLIVDDGSGSGLDYITLAFVVGGSLGGFILLFILIAVILIVVAFASRRTSRSKQVTVTEPPPKRQESLYLTDNIGYGASFGEQDEVIYDEIGDIGVGSRRHAVYGGNTEDANDMESYSVYDVVL